MPSTQVRELSVEAFLPFGRYANLINPNTEVIGAPPVEFYRDMIQHDLGGAAVASFSVCRVEPRPAVIDVSEYHTYTCEGILPLDNDVLIHVGPATPTDAPVPVEKLQVFRIPKGTMVVVRPGIWHHAPMTTNGDPANVLIVLPERTYANDCIVVELEEGERVQVLG